MSKLYLKPANYQDAEQEYLFVAAMPENENGLTNKWHGVSRDTFISEALPEMIGHAKGIDLPEGFVPATTLFLWNDTEIVGQFRLRHSLPESLIPGHIGYFITKEHRGKGFATEGLRLTLAYGASIIPEDEYHMRLNKNNPASLRVMLKNGGRIVAETEDKLIVKIPKPYATHQREVIAHYDALIGENNDPVRDPEPLKRYMDGWDGDTFIAALHLSKEKTVLEIGVGTGRLAVRVAPLCKNLTGIDISPKTIARAKENLLSCNNVALICNDFNDYIFESKYDVIYSSLTFMHINEKQNAISKVFTLLNPNGRFVLSIDKNQDEYIDFGSRKLAVYPDKPDEIESYLKQAGFEIEEISETGFAHIFTAIKRSLCLAKE